MAKRAMQDVVPPERRSIRNVILPNRVHQDEQPAERIPIHDHTPEAVETYSETVEAERPPRRTFMKVALWTGAALAVAFFVGTLMMVFARATVTVTPKRLPVSIDTTVTADRSGAPESLPFETITVARTSSASVEATGETFVNEKAKGTIVIYNNYSTAPQRLVKNTRFESPTGLIYRIDSSVTVPGRTTKNGVTTAGSVEAVVYADEAGDAYNIALTDFTIPGFKDDQSRYSKFYARSKTPMTGGFIGNVPHVDPAIETARRVEMEARLEERLTDEIAAAVPEGFTLFSSGVIFSTSTLPTIPGEKGGAVVQIAATATAYVLPEQALAEHIADIAIPNRPDEPVMFDDVTALSIKFTRLPSADNPTLTFTAKGQAELVWQYDAKALSEALAGQPIKSTADIISRFTGLDGEPVVKIRPVFKRSFPATPTKIEIVDTP